MAHTLTAIFQAVDRDLTRGERAFLQTHCPDAKVTDEILFLHLEETKLKQPGDILAMLRQGLDAGFSERSNGDRHYWVRLSQAPPAAFEQYNPRKGRRLYDWIPDESGPGGVFKVVRIQPDLFDPGDLTEPMADLVLARQLLQSGDLSLLFMANYANQLEVNRSMAVPLTLLRERSVGRRLARLLSVDCPIFEMLTREQRRLLDEDVNWVPDNWRLSVVALSLLALEAFQNGSLFAGEDEWHDEEDAEITADAGTDEVAAEQAQNDELESKRQFAESASYMVDFAADPRSTAAKILMLMKSGTDQDLKSAVFSLWYLKRQVLGTQYTDLPARTMERMLELTHNPSLLVSLLSEINSGDEGMF
ncbi:MAG: hypothetical protein ACKO3T_20775 [Planctomycetaceae bacterium]